MLLLSASSKLNSFVQLITVLILFVGVLALTWFVTRWTAAFQKGKMSGSNIEVLDTMKIAPNKYVEILRLTDKYIAVAVGKDTVTFLAELDEDAIIQKDATTAVQFDFQKVLDQVKASEEIKHFMMGKQQGVSDAAKERKDE